LQVRLDADAGGHGERADVVATSGALRRDEVRERVVRLTRRLALLLAQEVQPRQHARARFIRVDLDVVVIDAVGREQADHAPRSQPALADGLLEQATRVRVQVARLLADLRVGEDVRELAAELPGVEERHPVDVARQIFERVVVEDTHAEEARHRRHVRIPAAVETVGARLCDRQLRTLDLLAMMLLAPRRVLALDARDVLGTLVAGHQLLTDADRPRRVLHVHDGAFVLRIDLHRGVRGRSGRATDQQRQLEALPLHFPGNVHHLVERRRDQARQADHVGALAPRSLEDALARHHYAQVDDLEVVALEHDADDVLADVVHVALDGRHDDLAVRARGTAVGFLLLDVRDQVRDGLFHHARGLDDLGQEHLAGAEQVADDVHAVHQRPFDHLQRTLELLAGFFGVLYYEFVDAFDERMLQALHDRPAAPRELLDLAPSRFALVARRDLQQPLRGVGPAIQDHVLDALAQLRVDVFVDRQLPGVDDAHRQAGLDGVIQEYRVHRLAHRVVAAERERDVADAAADVRVRTTALDRGRRLDEIVRVVVVLLDAGGDREDIRIEDDVFRRKARLLGQQLVGALADRDLARDRVGLPLFVEGH